VEEGLRGFFTASSYPISAPLGGYTTPIHTKLQRDKHLIAQT
jgi:hypothetical protein